MEKGSEWVVGRVGDVKNKKSSSSSHQKEIKSG